MHHFGDPCIHCAAPHDEVAPGPCNGDPANVVVAAYEVIGQAWENPGSGCDTVRCFMSDGTVLEEAHHPSEHWPMSMRFAGATVRGRRRYRATLGFS